MAMDSAHLDVLVVGAVLCELSLRAALHGEVSTLGETGTRDAKISRKQRPRVTGVRPGAAFLTATSSSSRPSLSSSFVLALAADVDDDRRNHGLSFIVPRNPRNVRCAPQCSHSQ